MRRWLVSGLSMVLLFGCGDDESAPAPSPDAGATAVSDTGGASVSDTGTGGAVDAGMPADAASGETVADDTGEQGSDTGAEPIDDGLNGAPCTSPDDCADPEGYLCFGGFCAEICRDDLDGDGASDRIPEACGEVSSASMFGQGFACSSSLRICTPGPVEGQEIYCSKDAECDDVGAGTMVCGLAVLMSSDNRIVDGVCIPGGERNLTGASCQENVECESMLCRGNDPEAGQTGFCTNHCTQNQDCPTGNLCIGTGYLTGDDDTQASAWGGHCYPYEGSLDYCREQSECPAEDVCEAFVEPASLGAQYWCVARNEDGAAVGESCETGSDCNARRCLLGGSGQEGIDGMCTNTCQEASDCAEDMHCANVRLHNNGTPEIPEDDQLYGLCVRGAEGDPCLVGQQFWCEGELSCQQNEAWEAGFGLCAAPLGCHEEGGVVCDDGIECTLDECDASTGECVFSAVAPDWCFIDNGCVAAGASVDNTTCTVCDPSQSQSAASPVPDGTVCDDGDATTSNDACLAGVCACLSDCDGKVCGEDGCGGSCGDGCAEGDTCSADGTTCETPCSPDCEGKVCGDDGCGGSCAPGCGDGETCNDDGTACEAACSPDCSGKECGGDGCGGSCAPGCAEGSTCSDEGQCIAACTPACDAKVCGDDGCGGSCDPGCADGETCNEDGTACEAACSPDCEGKVCGDDGCGGSCAPGCGDGETCSEDGTACEAACSPDCSGKECGGDGCGGSCAPGCAEGSECSAEGQCLAACTPDCEGKVCGEDGCGGTCAPGCESGFECSDEGQCEAL